MVRNRWAALAAIALVCVAAVAIAAPETKTIVGTISSVDNTQRSMVVKDSGGNETTVYWNESARVMGDLKEGAAVRVDAKDQDGKTWAVSIQVQPAKKPY